MLTSAKSAAAAITPKLAWPLLVLLVVAVFYRPLGEAIRHASEGGGAEVSIGILRISIPKSDLPIPPLDVERVMPDLDSGMREFVIANVGGQNTPLNCYQDAGMHEFQPGSTTQKLARARLITFTEEKATEPDGRACLRGARVTYTPLYDQVRTYLLSVVLALKFTKA